MVVIRIAEIFIDPLLGNIIDNTKTKWGRFKPWQLIGGTVSAVLLVLVYTGLFGLVNVNTTLFIVLFVITFIVLDVFYSLRDISYWGMIPALSSDSHERSTYTALGSFGGSIGYNGLTIVVIPIVTYFSYVFTGKHQESQSGWTCFAIIVAILGVPSPCAPSRSAPRKAPAPCAPRPKITVVHSPRSRLAQNDQLLWGRPVLPAVRHRQRGHHRRAHVHVQVHPEQLRRLLHRRRCLGHRRHHHGAAVPDSEQAHTASLPVPRRYGAHGPRLPAVHRRHQQPRCRHRRPGVLLTCRRPSSR